MIRYQPPKSTVWGHQVGRLSAMAIVDRCSQFLNAKCTIINTQPSELIVAWNATHDSFVSGVQAETDQKLGQPPTVVERPVAGAEAFRRRRWPFSADNLPAVATCFDKLAEYLKTRDVVAQSSTFWTFAWRDEPPPLLPMQSAGGMFGVHLGNPHRITTMFSFRDFERYLSIKSYLAELDLTELSDKHLRPRMGVEGSKRRAQ